MDSVASTTFLVIDPSSQTVQAHTAPITADTLYALIGCDEFEAVSLSNGDVLWCDADRVPFNVNLDVFTLAGVTVPGSRAVVTGAEDDNGASRDCRMDAASARRQVVWHPGRRIVDETLTTVQTAYGCMPVIEFVYQPPL